MVAGQQVGGRPASEGFEGRCGLRQGAVDVAHDRDRLPLACEHEVRRRADPRGLPREREARPTEAPDRSRDAGLDPFAGQPLGAVHPQRLLGFVGRQRRRLCEGPEGLGQRMVGDPFDARDQMDQRALAERGVQHTQHWTCRLRQRARLVEHEIRHPGEAGEGIRAAQERALPEGRRERPRSGKGCRERQRAGAGHHEQRDGPLDRDRNLAGRRQHREGGRRERDDGAHEDARHAVGQCRRIRAGHFVRLAPERLLGAVLVPSQHAEHGRAADQHRAGGDLVLSASLDGFGFPRAQRLIEERRGGNECRVDRQCLTRQDPDQLPGSKRARKHPLRGRVGPRNGVRVCDRRRGPRDRRDPFDPRFRNGRAGCLERSLRPLPLLPVEPARGEQERHSHRN